MKIDTETHFITEHGLQVTLTVHEVNGIFCYTRINKMSPTGYEVVSPGTLDKFDIEYTEAQSDAMDKMTGDGMDAQPSMTPVTVTKPIKPRQTKTCDHCGKALPAGRTRFCRNQCKDDFHNAARAKTTKATHCEQCGKKLPKGRKRFCRNVCKDRWHNANDPVRAERARQYNPRSKGPVRMPPKSDLGRMLDDKESLSMVTLDPEFQGYEDWEDDDMIEDHY